MVIIMILSIFIIGIIFGGILIVIAGTQDSFPAAYLGVAIFLIIGLALFQTGLEMPTGTDVVPDGGGYDITDSYTTYYPDSDWVVGLIGYTFLLGGIVGMLMTTFYAFKS
jgi:hypothetical protein